MIALIQRIRNLSFYKQEGAALIIAIMILLILTVLGIYAVTTSTLETKIAGSERVRQEAFQAADGGTDYGRGVIELVLNNNPSLPCTPHDAPNTTLLQEILGSGQWDQPGESPWIEPDIGHCDMVIELDRIKAIQPEGEQAGFGEPAGETQATIYYRIDSTSSGIADASSRVQTIYRRKVHE